MLTVTDCGTWRSGWVRTQGHWPTRCWWSLQGQVLQGVNTSWVVTDAPWANTSQCRWVVSESYTWTEYRFTSVMDVSGYKMSSFWNYIFIPLFSHFRLIFYRNIPPQGLKVLSGFDIRNNILCKDSIDFRNLRTTGSGGNLNFLRGNTCGTFR